MWSRSFICVEVLEYLEPNKQYPTLVQYEDRKPHTNTSDECNRFPWLMKFSRFTKYELKKKIKANQMKINTLYNK